MSLSQQHRLERHDKVLLAARKCFVRNGFHATGMADIARACGMTAGNIYHYFPNKSAIVQAITDEVRSRLVPVFQPLENHADPLAGLVEIMRLSVLELCHDSNARLWMEIQAEAARNKPVRDICQVFDQEFQDILKRLMERAVQGGQLPADLNLEATALWLVALIDGAIARLSVQPELDMAGTLEVLAQGIRHGLCPVRT